MTRSVFAIEYNANNYMEAAFAPAEAKYKAQVMWDTWGHLEPKPNTYRGWLLFMNGAHGDSTIIDWRFQNVESGPLMYDHINDFIGKFCDSKSRKVTRIAPDGTRYLDLHQIHRKVGVYLFVGYYTRFKNYNGRFTGKTQRISIPLPVIRCNRRKSRAES
jgi:hypothetical protein